jgi:hypothetical protein
VAIYKYMKRILLNSALIVASLFVHPIIALPIIAIASYYIRLSILVVCAGIYFDILYGITDTRISLFHFVYTIIGLALYLCIEIGVRWVRK